MLKGITCGLNILYDGLLEQARMHLSIVFSYLEMSAEAPHNKKPTFAEASDRFCDREKKRDHRRYFEIKRDEAAAAD